MSLRDDLRVLLQKAHAEAKPDSASADAWSRWDAVAGECLRQMAWAQHEHYLPLDEMETAPEGWTP